MNPSPVVLIGIPALAAAVFVAFAVAVRRAWPERWGVIIAAAAGWVGVTSAAAGVGVLGRFDARPPPLMLFMASVVLLGVWLGSSALGARLAQAVPLWVLVGVQGFRLPLELVMHQAGVEGTMPEELSFSGYNFDVVTGATALIVAWRLRRGPAPAWVRAWSLLGAASLAGIVAVAVLTSPMVHAFGTDPRHLNTWVTQLPFTLLPSVMVVAAIAGHLVVWRALGAGAVSGKRASPAARP